MSNRTDRILEIIWEQGRTEVAVLASELGVSQVTVRKDLDELERQGIIIRERGFARPASPDDIAGRIACHYSQKQKIAARAAELVGDGETVMIENGSCCALLADHLAQKRRDLTIITNSAFIADYIRKKTAFQIILLGGIYQHDSQVNVGPLVREAASHFLVDRFFIGVDGYDPAAGFTNKDPMRAAAVQDMARQARQVVVLTESSKFSTRGTVPLDLASDSMMVYTDERISQADRMALEKKQVKVVLCGS